MSSDFTVSSASNFRQEQKSQERAPLPFLNGNHGASSVPMSAMQGHQLVDPRVKIVDKFPVLKGASKLDAEKPGPILHPRVRAVYEQHFRQFSDERSVAPGDPMPAYGHPYRRSRGSLKIHSSSDAPVEPSSYGPQKKKRERPSTAPVSRAPVLRPNFPEIEPPFLLLPPAHSDVNILPRSLTTRDLSSVTEENGIQMEEQ